MKVKDYFTNDEDNVMSDFDYYRAQYNAAKGKKPIEIDIKKLEDIEMEGVCIGDWPDLCDSFIASATINGRELTDDELEWLNENNSDFVYEQAVEWLQ